ncbi:methyltransferase [Nonomuraea jiangxiensis]|uniref:Ubiquinone/menaquinone biosynthesis C-methylase UbiE n=1 Tax=Nonomuraea jiangxiensis TaxID=633440 RepID=A0A1G8I8C1_9ACTN|nr:methyltransferase [Nonomuraea jiangxiensis]SDI15092.1 Ubiquinone/menaquinone biosynthesis C-methylase UbiE [Nonomuraea jiangxiensis]
MSDQQEWLTPEHLLDVAQGFMKAQVALAAAELGVWSELAGDSLGLADLSRRCGLHDRTARDFLDTLTALGLLRRDEDGRYANTPETAFFLDRAKPTYLGDILLEWHRHLYADWGHFTSALRSGEHRDMFASYDASRAAEFARSMDATTAMTTGMLAFSFDWPSVKTFADVGGGSGALAAGLAETYPHLRGVCFDLPELAGTFAAGARPDQVEFVAGDFFADPLPSADVLLMGRVLHDWDVPRRRALIAGAFAALPPGGTLLVWDSMIGDDRRGPLTSLLMSLTTALVTQGGEYTAAELGEWLAEAGFGDVHVQSGLGPVTLVSARKPER